MKVRRHVRLTLANDGPEMPPLEVQRTASPPTGHRTQGLGLEGLEGLGFRTCRAQFARLG